MDLNLHRALHDVLNYAYSMTDRTSARPLILSSLPYYYAWRNDGGMDIVTFEENDKGSLKFYRCSRPHLLRGIDLTEYPASLEGREALDFILSQE